MPELCASSVRSDRSAYPTSPSTADAGSSRSSRPSRDQLQDQHRGHRLGDRADPVLHVERVVPGDRRVRRTRRTTPARRRGPGPATTDGSRPVVWAWASRASSRRAVWSVTAASLRERFQRRAGADQVAVAVRLVDAGDRRPVLVGVDAGREDRELAGVGAVPLADQRARRCAGRRAAASSPGSTPPRRPGRSRRGSRSSPRRTGRSRRGPRTRSARPSACRRPGTTSSARGSRSRPAAWRRRRR